MLCSLRTDWVSVSGGSARRSRARARPRQLARGLGRRAAAEARRALAQRLDEGIVEGERHLVTRARHLVLARRAGVGEGERAAPPLPLETREETLGGRLLGDGGAAARLGGHRAGKRPGVEREHERGGGRRHQPDAGDRRQRQVHFGLVRRRRRHHQPPLGEHEHLRRAEVEAEEQRLAQVRPLAQRDHHALGGRLGARVHVQRVLGAVEHPRRAHALPVGRLALDELKRVGDPLREAGGEVEGAAAGRRSPPPAPSPSL